MSKSSLISINYLASTLRRSSTGNARTWKRWPRRIGKAFEGTKALIERRNEILQETLAQWQATVKDATSAEAMSKQAEAVKQGVEKAVANFRELSEMEAQARNNAWKVVQERIQENLSNLQKLLQPK